MNVQTDKHPHFTHDRVTDPYLGVFYHPHDGKTVWDLYYTPRGGCLHVAARCGNAPKDMVMVNVGLLKGLMEEQVNSEQILLCEAYRRAREKHYLA